MFGIKDNRRVGFASNGGGASRAAPQYQLLRTDEVRLLLPLLVSVLVPPSLAPAKFGSDSRHADTVDSVLPTATMRLSYRGGTRDREPGGPRRGWGLIHPSARRHPHLVPRSRRRGGERERRGLGGTRVLGGGGLPSVYHYQRPRNLQPRGKASLRALGRCGYTPESGRGVSLSFGRHLRYMRSGCQEGLGLVPGT